MVIIALLKSLNSIYQNSNFYKEARIVSFIDRLLQTIRQKIEAKLSLANSVYRATRDYDQFQQEIQHAKSIIEKFIANFFINPSKEEK